MRFLWHCFDRSGATGLCRRSPAIELCGVRFRQAFSTAADAGRVQVLRGDMLDDDLLQNQQNVFGPDDRRQLIEWVAM